MSESINHTRAFRLADRYAEYRLLKSWGIMMLVTAIVLLLYQILSFFMMILSRSEYPDFDLIFWWIIIPISYLLLISFLITPLILAIATYLTTKRTVIVKNEISSKRFLLFGFTLFFFYFNNFWLHPILSPIIFSLFFPRSIFIENGSIAMYHDSPFQDSAISAVSGGIACLFSYLLMKRITKRSKFKELFLSGVILILLFLILIILYNQMILVVQDIFPSYSSPPPFDILEELASWITPFAKVVCYLGCGLYSVRKAYQILEGRH
ncbi:MAG: hypothetical protein ACFFDT_34795 [Candidatus Hodarchaeota archaeon]